MLTIDQIKKVDLPINIWRTNNLSLSAVSPYNHAINLYKAIITVLDSLGTGATNLGASQASSTTLITSSSGDDVTILGADPTRSGVMTADQATELASLITLSGVAAEATNLGTFTGTTIADSSTIKTALQALETAVESATGESAQDAVGNILTDSSTINFTYDDGTPSITAIVIDDSITFAKMQNIATARLLGRSTASSGDIEELTVGSGLSLAGGVLSSTGGSGTVTSVAMSVPGILSVSGSPVTTTGTLAVSLATQSANTVLSGPTSGASTTPTFRALVSDDIPSLASTKISDFSEAVDDRVFALLVEGTGITITYDDTANTLTIEAPASGYTDEQAQDAIGTILLDSTTIDFTYNDSTPTITAGVKSNSISNTLLTTSTGGIYKGSGTIASGAAAKVTASSTFRINYSNDSAGITIDDVDLSTTIYSNNGFNFVYVNDTEVEIEAANLAVNAPVIFSDVIKLASVTTAQRDSLTPVNGMMIYNTDDNEFQGRQNGAWVTFDTTPV